MAIVLKLTKPALLLLTLGLTPLTPSWVYGEGLTPDKNNPDRTPIVGKTNAGVSQIHITPPPG